MKAVRLVALLIACLILFQTPCSASESPIPSQCIVIYGDTRTDHVAHRRVVDAIMKVRPTAVFHTGDLVEDGLNPNHWAIFNGIISPLIKTARFYPSLGNHENDSRLYFDNFDLPNNERWYSVEVDGIHFIVLDSNSDITKGSEQYQWLENDLRNIGREINFVIAIFHHPPFSTGPHADDQKGLRKSIVPLFEKYGVDMVFNGHTHAYERSLFNNIHYIVTGGGGAPLHDQVRTSSHNQVFIKAHHFCGLTVRDNLLTFSVFDIDLNLVDTVIVDRSQQSRKEEGAMDPLLGWKRAAEAALNFPHRSQWVARYFFISSDSATMVSSPSSQSGGQTCLSCIVTN
jgi:predicted MPP superfamily phosphohydrolase